MKAKKSLGQNFLVNDGIINKIIDLVDCEENDLIIEIGSGRGALTKRLSKLGCQYVGIEIDTDMCSYLEPLKVNIIYNDILNIDLNILLKNYKYKHLYVIGNLPYYITSPILEKLVKSNIDIYKMIFMVQKEVAIRYSAQAGHKDFGYMSLFLQYNYSVNKEFDVLRGNFNPVPKVDSSIITLTPNKRNLNIDFDKYTSFLKQAFMMKRKTLKNNLKSYDWNKISSVLKDNNLNEDVRAENISQEIFIKIYQELNK